MYLSRCPFWGPSGFISSLYPLLLLFVFCCYYLSEVLFLLLLLNNCIALNVSLRSLIKLIDENYYWKLPSVNRWYLQMVEGLSSSHVILSSTTMALTASLKKCSYTCKSWINNIYSVYRDALILLVLLGNVISPTLKKSICEINQCLTDLTEGKFQV